MPPEGRQLASDDPRAAALPPPGSFQDVDRGVLRSPPRSHHLAYIARELPRRIERLVQRFGPEPGCRVLDYGCADRPYRDLFPVQSEFIGADLPGNTAAEVVIDPDGRLPLSDASMDFVLSTQVLEHVEEPQIYLSECFRVLKPGGRLLLSTHGMMMYHPDPVDYWRWTSAGLAHVVSGAGLEILHLEGIMGMAAIGLQLFQDSMLRFVPRPFRPLLIIVSQTLVQIADRVESDESRRLNALVIAVVATKPAG